MFLRIKKYISIHQGRTRAFNSFLNLLVWVSAMQCNVECRLPEEDLILKDPPPHKSPPSERARVGGGGPWGSAPPLLVRPWYSLLEIDSYQICEKHNLILLKPSEAYSDYTRIDMVPYPTIRRRFLTIQEII